MGHYAPKRTMFLHVSEEHFHLRDQAVSLIHKAAYTGAADPLLAKIGPEAVAGKALLLGLNMLTRIYRAKLEVANTATRTA